MNEFRTIPLYPLKSLIRNGWSMNEWYRESTVLRLCLKALILNGVLFLSPVSRQNVIYTLGETFFNYTEHFKLYSAFCSSRSRVVELLQSGELISAELTKWLWNCSESPIRLQTIHEYLVVYHLASLQSASKAVDKMSMKTMVFADVLLCFARPVLWLTTKSVKTKGSCVYHGISLESVA